MGSFPFPVSLRPTGVPEPLPKGPVSPSKYTKRLALKKARAAARRVRNGLILGADTVVYFQKKILGKPRNANDALRMLRKLSGRWHAVYTGLALVAEPGGFYWMESRKTRVKMRSLSSREQVYWSERNHDKAGAYAAQARKNPFVEKYAGEFDNVVGLPRKAVKRLLARARKAGYFPAGTASNLSKRT